jgi:DNA-binding protein H-NS
MPKTAERLSEKSLLEWFSNLDFERQAGLLASLEDAHAGERQKRIDALRQELAALEGAGPRRRAKSSPKRVQKPAAKALVKYRDPKTRETWSGRGRMARWLAEKVKTGEKAEKYLASIQPRQ